MLLKSNYFSASFKNLYKSCESLVIFGYLKPNDLRIETEKSGETIFLKIYHGIYGLIGKFIGVKAKINSRLFSAMALLVNFLVALVDDSNKRANEMHSDPDVLQYIGKSVSKIRRKKMKDKRRYVYLTYNKQKFQ